MYQFYLNIQSFLSKTYKHTDIKKESPCRPSFLIYSNVNLFGQCCHYHYSIETVLLIRLGVAAYALCVDA